MRCAVCCVLCEGAIAAQLFLVMRRAAEVFWSSVQKQANKRRTVLFFQQIIYTQKSHGIIYKWLRDDLVVIDALVIVVIHFVVA